MPISMYQASVPPLCRTLTNLMAILDKGAAHAEAKGIEPTVLINSRLYPDMFPLSRQVQIASDVARKGVARLAGVDAPAIADTESTFPELKARLQTTVDYLKTFSAEQLDDTETKTVVLPVGEQEFTFAGLVFLQTFVIPNVYFHVTTAYDILRHSGVEVGKADYLGKP